ncbi:hypothetical protein FSP39_000800 [Pinctada imbricata]|uniref:PIPK domain-containing protein n=1 Tax=Pinctada imbricata TaxID=66713 RepID=A0AA89BTU1_PINIB|nr:hypothetical protein FSP39_000800 [Pinctada imbricata]
MATNDVVDVSDISRADEVPDGNLKGNRRSGTLELPTPGTSNNMKALPKEKIGHRRVDETGTVTYKKKPTSELMAAIQLGIGQSVGGLSSKPERDLLMQDFAVVESVFFPSEGSNLTPAHRYSDFRFKTYAPIAFRYFRELFNIQPDDFLLSLCDDSLKELSNPGASGSIFYLTEDDEFIIKTVQHKEAEFLQKLLPGYYMNLNQNPRTLLPKFYGFYCYQCGGKNIRFVIMNNLLPSSVQLHEKYDLKGSTYKRKASKSERSKKSPTLKDLDFMENHNQGILLEKEKYDAVMKTIQRDCRVLESFKIMDYSMLLGIYNLDVAAKQKGKESAQQDGRSSTQNASMTPTEASSSVIDGTSDMAALNRSGTSLARAKSIKGRIAQYSTAIESINQTDSYDEEEEDEDVPPGGIPAKNDKGERLLLYLGVIDILQSYRLKKKLEHTMKAIVIDGDTISVHRPSYYSQRFQEFMSTKVFRKMQTPLKHSPSKRKPTSVKKLSESEVTDIGRLKLPERQPRTISFSDDREIPDGTKGGRPDLLPENSTPPPTFAEAVSDSSRGSTFHSQIEGMFPVSPKLSGVHGSPPLSLSESTPTHTERTEGTPSYTPSSPSCYSDIEPAFQNELDKEEGRQPHVVESTGFVPTAKESISSVSQKLSEGQSSTSNDSSSYASALENLTLNGSVESRTKISSDVAKPVNSEDQSSHSDQSKVSTSNTASEQSNNRGTSSYPSTEDDRNTADTVVLEEEEMHSTNSVPSFHGDGLYHKTPHSLLKLPQILTNTVQTSPTSTSDDDQRIQVSTGEFILQKRSEQSRENNTSETRGHDLKNNIRNQQIKLEKHVRFKSLSESSMSENKIGAIFLPGQPKLYKPVSLRKFNYLSENLKDSFESTHL